MQTIPYLPFKKCYGAQIFPEKVQLDTEKLIQQKGYLKGQRTKMSRVFQEHVAERRVGTGRPD